MRLYDHNPAVGYSGLIQFREEHTGEFFFRSIKLFLCFGNMDIGRGNITSSLIPLDSVLGIF